MHFYVEWQRRTVVQWRAAASQQLSCAFDSVAGTSSIRVWMFLIISASVTFGSSSFLSLSKKHTCEVNWKLQIVSRCVRACVRACVLWCHCVDLQWTYSLSRSHPTFTLWQLGEAPGDHSNSDTQGSQVLLKMNEKMIFQPLGNFSLLLVCCHFSIHFLKKLIW